MRTEHLFPAAWSLWLLSWGLAARWSSRAVARPNPAPVRRYRALITLGFALIATAAVPALRQYPLWSIGRHAVEALLLVAVLGFLVTWWARLTLGTLWSGSVTRKAGHHIIDTGPYAFVRHPIYTGLLLAAAASTIAAATPLAALGFILFTTGIHAKARLEETFLAEQLGPQYAAYRQRVPMLIPFWPWSGSPP